MAKNTSPPSKLLFSRNASNTNIDAALADLPRYKAILLIENAFQEAMLKMVKSYDTFDLMHLLKCVKNHKNIRPTSMELKRPIPVEGMHFSISMKIDFKKNAEEIKIAIHIVYPNRTHILHSKCCPILPEEQKYIKLIREIECNYLKL